ncbi:MAG: histidine phosphatase family protein [Candidatus Micrarchaeota archaeon]|nr:histidine phosphatase family protein [Candidatus Micrarchaeota archaeon]
MIAITFEAHGTTVDNEARLSSGLYDAALSALGEKQARELGERYRNERFDAVFCSNLKRSYKTAELAFAGRFPIIKDRRLRECDYGTLTRHPSDEVEPLKIKHISTPFPGGESYEQANQRIKLFLEDLAKDYEGRRVMIIGHRATQYGLECLINGKSLAALVSTPFKWQPGWVYELKGAGRGISS